MLLTKLNMLYQRNVCQLYAGEPTINSPGSILVTPGQTDPYRLLNDLIWPAIQPVVPNSTLAQRCGCFTRPPTFELGDSKLRGVFNQDKMPEVSYDLR